MVEKEDAETIIVILAGVFGASAFIVPDPLNMVFFILMLVLIVIAYISAGK